MLAAPKPLASLSSGLLARKGQARPAMRRPSGLSDFGSESIDDLGWNDMGEALPVAEAPLPPVLEQREKLADLLATAEVAQQPALAPAAGALAPSAGKRRTAFTLRLDAERHLRLRLASATRGVSAQKLVTEALDDFLKTMPELAPLAASAAGAK
jgi:hypothetical protein